MERDSLAWDDPLSPISLDKINANLGGAQALGINNIGNIVGSSFDDPDNNPNNGNCVKNATLWRAGSQTLVNLGNLFPLDDVDDTVANAVNNTFGLQIVGVNNLTKRALLWEEMPGGGWEDVLNLDIAGCDRDNVFTLVEALDINDSGWIVARGVLDANPSEERAYLLRRVDACPPDLDGDGYVNQRDLDILVANWTGNDDCIPCGDLCGDCNGDIDDDCKVGITDYLALLGAFGPCPGFGACPSGGVGSSASTLEECVQALGFNGVSDCQSWLATASEGQAYAMAVLLVSLLPQ